MDGYTLHVILEDGAIAESMNYGAWVDKGEAVETLKWEHPDAIAIVNGIFETLWEHPDYSVEVA